MCADLRTRLFNCRMNTLRYFVLTSISTALMLGFVGCRARLPDLHQAAKSGNVKEVAQLIDAGADVNDVDHKGATALHFAVIAGNREMVKLLLDRGADLEIATPLGVTPLFAAISAKNSDMAGLLLEQGANVNVANSAGTTALILAASEKMERVAIKLIEEGADVHARTTKHGTTALIMAVSNDLKELVQHLLDAGADPTVRDNHGRSAMHYSRSIRMARFLKSEGDRFQTENVADSGDPDDIATIQECFAKYEQAVVERDGPSAIESVDSNTISYYSTLREHALSSDATTVRSLPPMDQFIVLRMRLEIPLETLQAMDGAAVLGHGIERGWTDASTVEINELGRITVAGDSAQAVHVMKGSPTALRWQFRREGAKWKLDLSEFMSTLAQQVLEQLIRDSGETTDAFLLDLLETVSEKQVDASIWEPLISNSAPAP